MSMITKVYLWQNDMVMVFDENGEQMPDYQGRKADVWDRIVADAPPTAVFMGGNWQSGEVYGLHWDDALSTAPALPDAAGASDLDSPAILEQ